MGSVSRVQKKILRHEREEKETERERKCKARVDSLFRSSFAAFLVISQKGKRLDSLARA